MRRRQMLSGTITTAAAGSAGRLDTVPFDDQQRYHLEVIVQNDHDQPYEVRTTVTDAEESVVFEDWFTLANAKHLAAELPNVEAIVIDDVGHLCNLQAPDAYTDAVRRFVEETNFRTESRREGST